MQAWPPCTSNLKCTLHAHDATPGAPEKGCGPPLRQGVPTRVLSACSNAPLTVPNNCGASAPWAGRTGACALSKLRDVASELGGSRDVQRHTKSRGGLPTGHMLGSCRSRLGLLLMCSIHLAPAAATGVRFLRHSACRSPWPSTAAAALAAVG